jgi:hypothetical protein
MPHRRPDGPGDQDGDGHAAADLNRAAIPGAVLPSIVAANPTI